MSYPAIDFNLEGLPEEYHTAVLCNERFAKEGFFPEITGLDEKDYRQWAREHYQPEQMITPTWHPVVVDECIKIIKEFIAD